MSDKIRSKDGKYEGTLEGEDGNFVVRRTADGKQIAALVDGFAKVVLGDDTAPALPLTPKPESDPSTVFPILPLPPEPNQQKFFFIALILLIGIPLLFLLVPLIRLRWFVL